MKTISIYSRGKSLYQHIKTDLDTFIRKVGLDVQIKEITDVQTISEKNPARIPFLTMNGSSPIFMKQGEYIHTFCSRVRSWLVDAVGTGSMTRVLVPTDFSDASLNALRYALNQYRGSFAVIELLSAHMDVVGSVEDVPVMDSYAQRILKDKMSKLITQLMADEENEGLIIKGRTLIGPIVHSIIKTSEESDRTVIYVGSSGESGIIKSFFGSVTRQLVKRTSVPMFIIPPDYKGSSITDVGFAVSNPIQDAPLFKILYELIGAYKPTLHLIHSQSDDDDFDFEPYMDLSKTFKRHLIKTMLLTDRDIASNLLKHINTNNFHLMVMSHYERPILEALFHKSISKQVAAGINCPILILNKSDIEMDQEAGRMMFEAF